MVRNDREIIDKLKKLNVWRQAGTRAVHKPLLLLLALGRFSREEPDKVKFEEVYEKLASLLKEFGPTRKTYHPEYPFWRLQHDELWVFSADDSMRSRKSNSDPPKSELIRASASGKLSSDVLAELRKDASFLDEMVSVILEDNFPHSIHSDIIDAVGIRLSVNANTGKKRDPDFRRRVFTAYGYGCAVCGFDMRLIDNPIGLEAAHIMWHNVGGPDIVSNGILLCSLHHKIFDLGAFTIDGASGLLVSEQMNGSQMLSEALMRYHKKPIRLPQRDEDKPDPRYLKWHRKEVFKERPRP